MIKDNLLKNGIAIVIIFLFMVSTLTPLTIGTYSQGTNVNPYIELDESTIENYNFNYCYRSEITNYDFEEINTFDVRSTISSPSVDNVPVKKEPIQPVNSGPMNSSWPMKCHDTHHTGRSPYGTTDNPYDELWQYDFNYRVDADPAIGEDGTIYIGGGHDNLPWYLYAFYPNGTLKWRYYAEGLIWHMCPALAEDGTIYIGAWDGSLHAVNPDGTSKWEFGTGDNIVSDPVIGEDGTIYFGTMWGVGGGGKVFAVNPDGTEKWRYQTGGGILSDPAIGDDGTIYIGSDDHHLYALYPNGTLRWKYETGDWVDCPPSIADDGTIYFASWDDYLYAVYPNGTLRWKTEILYGSNTNPTIGLDGTIYISSASKLFAINPDNGDIEWEFDFGGHVLKSSSAICADGIIYTGIEIGDRDGGEIVAVNPDGTERWRKRLSNRWCDSSPCIGSDGAIYISAATKNPYGAILYAFGDLGGNHPPHKPMITGETEGSFGVSYDYTFKSLEPDGDNVSYYVDWGDDSNTGWLGPYPSEQEIIVNHTWGEEGSYTISAKAKDDFDAESEWAYLEVTMPVNQQYSSSLFHRFLERFPNAFPILRNLLGL